MYDLIYLDYYGEATEVLQGVWPAAKIEDASDFIHTERLAIEVPDIEEEEYFKVIMCEGIALSSLNFHSLMLEDGQNAIRLAKEVVEEDPWKTRPTVSSETSV